MSAQVLVSRGDYSGVQWALGRAWLGGWVRGDAESLIRSTGSVPRGGHAVHAHGRGPQVDVEMLLRTAELLLELHEQVGRHA